MSYINREDLLRNTHTGMSAIELMQAIIDAPVADVRENVRGKWEDEQILIAEIITDYIASCKWLSIRDQETLAHFRNDYCCINSAIGEHRCAVRIERSPQSGLKPIVCDTCLQSEIYDLNIKKGIVTIGSCCGHGDKQGFIQVMPKYVKKMHELGYEQLPEADDGQGKWCFKPKTFLLRARKAAETHREIIDKEAIIKAAFESAQDEPVSDSYKFENKVKAADAIEELTAEIERVKNERQWIEFKTRPLTEEEREDHPAWDDVLDCKLPDDGQRILVNIKCRGYEPVQMDEFFNDGDGCYLDSGYALVEEATHWMPLPSAPTEE